MPLLIVVALMTLPFLEIWLMILVGGQIGVSWTIALLCALSVSGVLVVRGAGRGAYADAQRAVRAGTPPGGALLDTLMLLVGGVLLVTPGFLTAAVGALLVLPITRPLLRRVFRRWAERRVERARVRVEADLVGVRPGAADRRPGAGRVIQGRIVTDEDPERG